MHGRGVEHNRRLAALLQRMKDKGFTLTREKCHFGVKEVIWFGHRYSEKGMADPDKFKVIQA